MKPASKTAAKALSESPLAGLLEQAVLLGRVASLVAEVGPEAADPARRQTPFRCSFEGRTIVISVRNPSQAAKLRQRSAELERRLREYCAEVTGIRIRHQPGAGAEPDAEGMPQDPDRHSVPSQETLSAALRFADELSHRLHDSALRQSVQRLRATLQSRLSPGDKVDGPGKPDPV